VIKHMTITIDKPKKEDIKDIQDILREWRTEEDVNMYGEAMLDEIKGKVTEETIYRNMRFWTAKNDDKAIGIICLCEPLPKLSPFFKSEKPGAIQILYIHNQWRHQGIGRKLVSTVESEARNQGYTELIVRSAPVYETTAWVFYDKVGYQRVGTSPTKDGTEMMQVFYKKL